MITFILVVTNAISSKVLFIYLWNHLYSNFVVWKFLEIIEEINIKITFPPNIKSYSCFIFLTRGILATDSKLSYVFPLSALISYVLFRYFLNFLTLVRQRMDGNTEK